MISQDTKNLAVAFAAFGETGGNVTLTEEQFWRLALALDDLADRIAMLESVVVPPQARLVPFEPGSNVVPLPRSKPWGGHPPGSGRNGNPPGGGAA